jgi:hypothetical protein
VNYPITRLDLCPELQDREQTFHHPNPGTTRDDLEQILAPGFWRIGARGAVYDREESLAVFMDRFAGPTVAMPWAVSEGLVQQLDQGTFLHTYRLHFTGRITSRATVWARADQRWSAMYHQATEVRDA